MIELFMAKVAYHEPYFTQEAIKFFKEYSLVGFPVEFLSDRLRVMNILQMSRRFPMTVLDNSKPDISNVMDKVMWLNLQPAFHNHYTI